MNTSTPCFSPSACPTWRMFQIVKDTLLYGILVGRRRKQLHDR